MRDGDSTLCPEWIEEFVVAFDGRILSGVSVLSAVVEGGSFTKAARLIGLTDSGVSRAISRLDQRLGIRLLDRTTRSVTLRTKATVSTKRSVHTWPQSKTLRSWRPALFQRYVKG